MTNREAIKIINQYDMNFHWNDGEPIPAEQLAEAFDLAISALEKQEADRWIPVTERLPEEDKGLLVTDGYGEIRHAVYIDWLEKVEFRTIEESITLYDVKAWRPLPEPYTEEES
jgi:hypothetical protein